MKEEKNAEKDVEGDHYFMLVVVSHAKRVKTRTKSGKATQDKTIEKQEEEKSDRSIKGMKETKKSNPSSSLSLTTIEKRYSQTTLRLTTRFCL